MPHSSLSAPDRMRQLAVSLFLLVVLATSAFGQRSQILLGHPYVQGSSDNNPSGVAEAFPVQAAFTGQVSSLSVFLGRTNGAPTVWVGLYTNASGHPQALMSAGAISNPNDGRWNSVAIPAVQITRGTTYWFALLGVNGVVQFRDRNGSCQSEKSNQTTLGSLSAAWVSGARSSSCGISMFGAGRIGSGSTTPGVSVSVSPHTVSLHPGQSQQFTAAVSGVNNPSVVWTASGGTINSTGLYTAPSSAGTYTVTAKASASGTGSSSSSAVVTVAQTTPTPPPTAATITISPTAASLQTGQKQQFSATVSGTTNTAVTWSASAGTITSSGMYTAPSTAGTYTIKAVSAADSTKSASAMAIVSAPQSATTVTLSPTNTSIGEAGQVQLTATVSGLSNKAVTWAVTRGNGTITQSGLYTAPKAAETDVVTATSQADSTKSATASINVLLPHSVSLSWEDSQTTTVSFYKVYRGTVSGGPYTLLATNIKGNSYTDTSVQSGLTYYYVTTAVDADGVESVFSNQMSSKIPSP